MMTAAQGRYWEPQLCVLYPGYPLADEVRQAGIPVTELSGGKLSPRRALRLRTLSRRGVDVVHSSLWGSNAVARVVCAGPGRPAVVISERRVEDFRSAPQRLLDHTLRRITDEYSGNSTDVATFIARAHGVAPERITTIRNGIDTSVFYPTHDPRPGPDPDRPLRIGAVGRLVHQKGFDILVACLPELVDRRNVEVVVVGEGELRSELETAGRGLPITFPGALPTPAQVADFLRSLDVFVMPSRYEGLPNAVLEAAACGVPVIATDVPGSAEAADAVTRFIPPESPHDLAEALLEVGAGAAAHHSPAISSFDEVAAAHLAVFERAVARRAGTAA